MLTATFLPLFMFFQAPSPMPSAQPRPSETPQAQAQARPISSPEREEPPIVSKHSINIGGRTLNYTTTTGFMPIKNAVSGETEARMFYIAYTLDGVTASEKRPLMFSFNGGP